MKNNFTRDWLGGYKVNPRKDDTIYKNYQNPGMTRGESQWESLSPAQKERYHVFLNDIPEEVKGLSAPDMQKYLAGMQEKENNLRREQSSYVQRYFKLKDEAKTLHLERNNQKKAADQAMQLKAAEEARQEKQRQELHRQNMLKQQEEMQRKAQHDQQVAYAAQRDAQKQAIRDRTQRRQTKLNELSNAVALKNQALNSFVNTGDRTANLNIDRYKTLIEQLTRDINSGNY